MILRQQGNLILQDRCHKKNQLIPILTLSVTKLHTVPPRKNYPCQPECALNPTSVYTISIYHQPKLPPIFSAICPKQ
ncbi:hypothetical protein EYC80_003812 [Monilinia laxa]|uniref:Uncharacterized protein n=1 Tax=Monilinia laxa TaxID=61186 RepID=A0A5N6KMR7_MONLA|nr:hypothetical protein EYC80_003812 [Monilinia laxa]